MTDGHTDSAWLKPDDDQAHPCCPNCGAPLMGVHRHIPDNVVREYRCGVRWLDVDDERVQVVLSGSPLPCRYVRELHAKIAVADDVIRELADALRDHEADHRLTCGNIAACPTLTRSTTILARVAALYPARVLGE